MSFDHIDGKFRAPPVSAFDRIDRMFDRVKVEPEIDPTSLDVGCKCPKLGCSGTFSEWHGGDMFGSCSCHLNPPCSWCVDATIICNECDYEPWDRP